MEGHPKILGSIVKGKNLLSPSPPSNWLCPYDVVAHSSKQMSPWHSSVCLCHHTKLAQSCSSVVSVLHAVPCIVHSAMTYKQRNKHWSGPTAMQRLQVIHKGVIKWCQCFSVMSAKQILRLAERWRVDDTKFGRDLGTVLKQKVRQHTRILWGTHCRANAVRQL